MTPEEKWEAAKAIWAAYNEAVEVSLGNIKSFEDPEVAKKRAEVLYSAYKKLT